MKELNQIYKLRSSEDTFRSSTRLLICLCQFFGVAPMPIPLNKSQNCDGLCWKLIKCLHRIWCLVIIIGVTTSFYYQHVKFNTIAQYSQIKVLLHIGEYISIISSCVICVIGSQINRNLYEKYYQNVMDIDSMLTECGSRLNSGNLKRFIVKCIAMCLLFETVMSIIFALSFLNKESSVARNIALYIIPHILVLLVIIEYGSLLYTIRERYHSISVLLKKISFDLLFKKECRQTQAAVMENKICQKLNCLRLAFLDISKFAADVNGTFGILILSILVSTFLILSTEFFSFYEFVEKSAPDFYVPILSVLWILFYGGRIIFVVIMNHLVNIEVRTERWYTHPKSTKISKEIRSLKIIFVQLVSQKMVSIDRFFFLEL